MRTFAGLLVLAFAGLLAAQDYTLPLLELRQERGKWGWYQGEEAKDAAELKLLLGGFAEHADAKAGWTGLDENGISRNVLLLHVSELAPIDQIMRLIEAAAGAKIWRIVLGSVEAIETPAAAGSAPHIAKLDPAYLLIELPVDAGLNAAPQVPKETVCIQSAYDSTANSASYQVSIDARGRKPVEESNTPTRLVVYAAGESENARKAKSDRRAKLRERVSAAAQDYIAKAGDKIEVLTVKSAGEGYRPWLFYELAARAAHDVNLAREKAGQKKLSVNWGWSDAVPPPPEMWPEKEVEFPKDEPDIDDPTEDPRIVEDATDEVNEDPSNSPNSDLAENPNDDPSDNESPHPSKDNKTPGVGLGGGVGGSGGRSGKGFAHRRASADGRPHEDRMNAALEWLKDHQDAEGYWSSTYFSGASTRKAAKKTYNIEFVDRGDSAGDTGWEATCDTGLTGLALLAYAGGGYTHKEGEYRTTIRQTVLYLRRLQHNDGCFGAKEDDHYVYNHVICTMAMAEIYGISGDAVLKPSLDKAVEFILKAQNPGMGWRYGVQPGNNDSSVTGWMVLALKSAKLAGIEVETEKCYSGAAEWFKLVTVNADGYPKCGYDSPGSNNARLRSAMEYTHNPSMDAIYIMSMLSMGKADLNDSTIKAMARACTEKNYLPKWGTLDMQPDNIDFYYWYYASLALYQVGGSVWQTWSKEVFKVLCDNQRGWHAKDKQVALTSKETLDEHGSWDPVGAWGKAGGRVYSTALGALILQTGYRYQRIEEQK